MKDDIIATNGQCQSIEGFLEYYEKQYQTSNSSEHSSSSMKDMKLKLSLAHRKQCFATL